MVGARALMLRRMTGRYALHAGTGQRGALVVDDKHLVIANDHPEHGNCPGQLVRNYY
jgi:hypothetical protein